MAITLAIRDEVARLYVGLFGRAPDGEGLGFWAQQRDQGQSLAAVAEAMFATAPARAYYPTGASNDAIVTSFYANTLGRAPDAQGLAFWSARLAAPGATPGAVISELVSVVASYAGTDAAGLDSAALFNNRVDVARHYGERNFTAAGSDAVVRVVTKDPATAAAVKDAIDAAATDDSDLIWVPDSLTAGIDVLAMAAGRGVGGNAATSQAQDSVVGSSSASDTVVISGAAAVPQLSGVEFLRLDGPTAAVDVHGAVGLQNVQLRGQADFHLTVGSAPKVVLLGLAGTGNVLVNDAAASLTVTMLAERFKALSWAAEAGTALAIHHTAGAPAASVVMLPVASLPAALLTVGGVSLAAQAGLVALPSQLEAGRTNIAVTLAGNAATLVLDLNNNGSYDSAADLRIVVLGHAAPAVSYDAAAHTIVFGF